VDAGAVERNLLFGLLALQNGLIDQAALVAAFQAWTRRKDRPLAEHLTVLGFLDADGRLAVEAMAAFHLKTHGGDVGESLASLPANPSIRESLAGIADPDLLGTLVLVGAAPDRNGAAGEAEGIATLSVGSATSSGQRFLILRPEPSPGWLGPSTPAGFAMSH
jgi:hypothetical protein